MLRTWLAEPQHPKRTLDKPVLCRRSLGVVSSLKSGHKLSASDFLLRKPAGGDYTYQDIERLIGKYLVKDIQFDQLLSTSHFEA